MSGVSNYPNADIEVLRRQYVGSLLHEIEGPAAIIDVAVARRNCELMLNAAESIGVDFRSHVKSHKTTELTRYQVGDKLDLVKLVVSTIAEAEQLLPYLQECKANGRSVDVVYGLPVSPSCLPRLSALGQALGEGSITVLVDSLDILPYTSRYHDVVGHPLGIFIKLDTGYHRAGVPPQSTDFNQLVTEIHRLESSEAKIKLRGFYSHLGSSYGSDSSSEALDYLATELEGCTLASIDAGKVYGNDRQFTFSVGATPTTTSAQALVSAENDSPAVLRVRKALNHAKEGRHVVELHAGAYVTLDMQQLAAHARTSDLSFKNVAVSVLTEVASSYSHRDPAPEALIPCGKLSLGYDTCKNYEGMGVVMSWLDRAHYPSAACDAAAFGFSDGAIYNPDAEHPVGWIVHRASQEHGMLRWIGPVDEKHRPLRVGEKIRIIPNHCCMCLANYSFVLVVDSDAVGEPVEKERVCDVWLSWRGW